jgi:hypothetical protein
MQKGLPFRGPIATRFGGGCCAARFSKYVKSLKSLQGIWTRLDFIFFNLCFQPNVGHLTRRPATPTEDRYFLSQAANACANARLPDSPFSKARMA